jgi:hypothetical protein
METSHRHLAITGSEWDAFMDDLQTTLDKFSVPAAEQAEVKALIESTHAAIVVSDADRVEPSPAVAERPKGSAAITSSPRCGVRELFAG